MIDESNIQPPDVDMTSEIELTKEEMELFEGDKLEGSNIEQIEETTKNSKKEKKRDAKFVEKNQDLENKPSYSDSDFYTITSNCWKSSEGRMFLKMMIDIGLECGGIDSKTANTYTKRNQLNSLKSNEQKATKKRKVKKRGRKRKKKSPKSIAKALQDKEFLEEMTRIIEGECVPKGLNADLDIIRNETEKGSKFETFSPSKGYGNFSSEKDGSCKSGWK